MSGLISGAVERDHTTAQFNNSVITPETREECLIFQLYVYHHVIFSFCNICDHFWAQFHVISLCVPLDLSSGLPDETPGTNAIKLFAAVSYDFL
jgi:hypothetical protein